MVEWKDLPYEVVLKFAQEFKGHRSEGGWMFVNRQLHEIYEISIFDKIIIYKWDPVSDQLFNKIVTSPFKPGKYVKKISVRKFRAPTATTLDNVDPLHLLMTHCPYVKAFEFKSEFKEDEGINWVYFSSVLMDCDIWKLEWMSSINCLPYCGAPAYFNSAFSMRRSLRSLKLTKGMIRKVDYHLLATFQQLEEIEIGTDMLDDLYDCQNILVHLPTTVKSTTFKPFRTNQIQVSDHRCNTIFDDWKHIKKLTFTNYYPTTDEELLFLMEHFSGVRELYLLDDYNNSENGNNSIWPTSIFSKSCMDSFLNWVFGLQSCRIDYNSPTANTDIINVWNDHIQQGGGAHKSDHRIGFSYVNDTNFTSGASIHLSTNNSSLNGLKKFVLSSTATFILRGGHNEINHSNPIQSLYNLSKNVQEVDISLPSFHEFNVGHYLNSLLSTGRPHLKRIYVFGGKLSHYNDAEEATDIKEYGNNISRRLTINETRIDEDSLTSLLTNKFRRLKHLKLSECQFFNAADDVDRFHYHSEGCRTLQIAMPETTLDLLEIGNYCWPLCWTKLLISVISKEQNIVKYYSTNNVHEQEINQKTFDSLKEKLKADRKTAVLSVTAKSVKNLEISVWNNVRKLMLQMF